MQTVRGFTLVELLVALTIIGILVGTVTPMITSSMDRNRIRIAGEEFNAQLAWIKSEAVKRNNTAYISFIPGTSWCFGFSVTGFCDCSNATSCVIDSTTKRVTSSDMPKLTMTTTYPVQSGSIRGFTVDRDGMPDTTNSVTFTNASGGSAVVSVNIIGNVSTTYP